MALHNLSCLLQQLKDILITLKKVFVFVFVFYKALIADFEQTHCARVVYDFE